MRLPPEHPDRTLLHEEIHARPSDPLVAPLRVSYLALESAAPTVADERAHLGALLERFGAAGPDPGANHLSSELDGCRLKWERHTEFTRYTVTAPSGPDPAREPPALACLPEDWVAELRGVVLVAAHCFVYAARADGAAESREAERYRQGGFVGTQVAGGAASVYADFQIGPDRFSRYLIFDHHTTPHQLGRTVQRLLEINTYWLLALRGLPVARELGDYLSAREADLRRVNQSLAGPNGREEAHLLEELTRLEAEIGDRAADNAFRFGASRAYHRLVQARLKDLREVRLPGLQTLSEFAERRLGPAMHTCLTAEERQHALLERASRSTQLLATRVGITSELQTQAVLTSMNRRTRVQLRLQQTVEGLSVAAITYYVVGLVAYFAEGAATAGVPVEPALAAGIAIPLVAALVWLGVRRIRRAVESEA